MLSQRNRNLIRVLRPQKHPLPFFFTIWIPYLPRTVYALPWGPYRMRPIHHIQTAKFTYINLFDIAPWDSLLFPMNYCIWSARLHYQSVPLASARQSTQASPTSPQLIMQQLAILLSSGPSAAYDNRPKPINPITSLVKRLFFIIYTSLSIGNVTRFDSSILNTESNGS